MAKAKENPFVREIEDEIRKRVAAQGERDDARSALALAEARIKEQKEVLYDLLLLTGTRTTCAKCNAEGFWIKPPRYKGRCILIDLNGCQHWPGCPGAAPPEQLEITWKTQSQ